MKYRKFGKTDLLVSEVGFGAWAIGGNSIVGNTPIGWGPADDKTSAEAIRKSVDVGINFFDTADFYGLGHSEEILAKEIAADKTMLFATKVGHRVVDDTIQLDYSKDYIINACEASLKRLKRDYIDYYQSHSAKIPQFENDRITETMELLKQQGKIRHWGASLNTFAPDNEGDYLIENKAAEGFQVVFNLMNQFALPLIEKSYNAGYGIIARMPLQFGLLTGKFSSDTSFTKDDHRSFRLNSEVISKTNQIIDGKIVPLCEKYSISKTELAMSFILSFDSVSTVIPGIRTAQHAIDNTKNIKKLEAGDLGFLKSLYQSDWSEIIEMMRKLG
jgi:aryl-alcohol dehydrogenase-like predicted oxidoreductase